MTKKMTTKEVRGLGIFTFDLTKSRKEIKDFYHNFLVKDFPSFEERTSPSKFTREILSLAFLKFVLGEWHDPACERLKRNSKIYTRKDYIILELSLKGSKSTTNDLRNLLCDLNRKGLLDYLGQEGSKFILRFEDVFKLNIFIYYLQLPSYY